MSREVLFREAVLAFMGVKEKTTKEDVEDSYCKVCKQAKKDVDCSTCSKQIDTSEYLKYKEETKTIGYK